MYFTIYESNLQSFSFTKKRAVITIISGNTADTTKPALKLMLSAVIPKSQGPREQPKSPQRAKILNISVPADKNLALAIE